MITGQQAKEIATLLKIDPATFTAALTSPEEVAIAIPTGLTVATPEDMDRVKTEEYTKGKTAGVEMAVKEAKDKHGLDFNGKTIDGLVTAIKTKTEKDLKLEPNARITELEKDKTTLQTKVTELEAAVTTEGSKAIEAANVLGLYRELPSLGENAPDVSTVMALMKSEGYELAKEGEALVFKKGGEVVKDSVAKPIGIKDVVTNYAKEKKLIAEAQAQPGGRGGKDSLPGTKPTNLAEMKAKYEGQGKSIQGVEFMAEVSQAVKDNPDFSMD